MTTNSNLYAVRDSSPLDKSFIMSTFLKGLRFGNDVFREIKSDVFFKEYQKIVTHLLEHHSTEVKVACLSDDPEVILGYSVHSNDGSKLHFTFVKSAWRGIGICKSLVPPTVKTVTHITKIGLSLARKHGLEYNPFHLV